MEQTLSRLFRYGTILASIVVAIGLASTALELNVANRTIDGSRVMTAGIAMFALLPVAGVCIMAGRFGRIRDWWLAAISVSVLIIILVGVCMGVILGKTSH